MRALIDSIFIFAFVIMLFALKMPSIEDDNYIRHKLFIFTGIFMFDFMLQTVKKLRSKCNIKTETILFNSLKTAMFGIIGYSLYTDLIHMEDTKDYFNLLEYSFSKKIVLVTIMIVAFITLMKVLEIVLLSKYSDCE